MSYKKSIGLNLESYVMDVDNAACSGSVFKLAPSETIEFELYGTGSVIVENITSGDSASYGMYKMGSDLRIDESFGAPSFGASSESQDTNMYISSSSGKLTLENNSSNEVEVKIASYIS